MRRRWKPWKWEPPSGLGHRRPPGRIPLLLAQLLVYTLFAVLAGRMWYLQVPMNAHYRDLAVANHAQQLIVPATRGQILDAAGRSLVRNRTELVVSADYHAVMAQDDNGEGVLRKVARVLGVPEDEVLQRIRLCGPEVSRPCWPGSPYQPVTLVEDVDPKKALQILERQEDFPGISAQQHAVREYPNGERASQTLGYLQPVTQEELEAREELRVQFSGIDHVGRDGLEAMYDDRLRGTAGVRTLGVNNKGQVIGVLEEKAPEPGMHLVTHLDERVQAITEKALERGMKRARGLGKGYVADSAAAVVLDVRTGGVIAMASVPTYDPEVWNGGIDQETYDEMLSKDAGEPLISRALQGQYPPGSTFKVSSLAAAVKNGSPLNGTYACPGSINVGNRSFQNYEGAGHGSVSLHKAIVVSCNTVFYKFGYDMWREDGGKNPSKNPQEVMSNMAKSFGFGAPTGIDLPNESSGRIPDRQWKREFWESTREQNCKRAEKGYPEVEDGSHRAYLEKLAREHCETGFEWNAGEAVNFSIGQGDVLVTPLQLANAYAAIANGGTLYEPRVGKAFVSADGKQVEEIPPKELGKLDLDDETLAYLQKALTQVPKEGTGRGAFDGFPQGQVSIAGKTGSATIVGKKTSSWFASYAPADDPRFAVAVLVSQGGTGGTTSAPIVREIYEGIYGFVPSDDAAEPGEEGEEDVKPVDPALPGGKPPSDLPEIRPDGTVVAAGE
ncbi:penicillin-binding protein 2 [Nocardiopsis mwathae]|uniref:Penicillin-binding protein 2 n=1 Tax=Nocardiopsis mwathae TaxID=1472723 RepID=A0A7X0D4J8_9ACTN|nr:penicillin-binding protein 2 [Nocardiopsis mwathae]MBB6170856.1 penicillin-binding protein 2 [Nocardiopsis mwathae]